MRHLWCSDGGFAAVYGLDSTPAKGTQPAEGAQPRKATQPLATQAIAEHEMAKFTPMELMSEVHGKLHGKSKYYAAEKYGTQYTGLIGEITVPPTENQLTARDKFKQARQNVGTLSEEEIAAYQEAFSKYRGKYKTLQGYMLAKEYAKLV